MFELWGKFTSWVARNGSASDWLTALGTIGAVATSLYFSYRKERTKALVNLEFTPEYNYDDYGVLTKSGRQLAKIIFRNVGNNHIILSALELKMHEIKIIESLDVSIRPNEKYVYNEFIVYPESESKYIRFQFRDINGKIYKTKRIEWDNFKKILRGKN